ncbi:hypothetical protein ACIQVE_07035 [Pseudomonas sp. NPDC098747]|uniref:hypothetical protein n=1 Tax=Pseudomonas sp. NPDC098747 TaxID=3364487 RepID=UPI00383BB5FE
MKKTLFAAPIFFFSLCAIASTSSKDEDAKFAAAYKAEYGEYDGTRTGQLLEQAMSLHSQCRGGSGDDPKTWKACDKQEIPAKELQKLGWCYGESGQSGSEEKWHLCSKK